MSRMLEWNAFVKPIIYVIELVFGAVVTFGTADKLLYQTDSGTRCALNGSLRPCISVIVLGSCSLLTGLYVLWRRAFAAFNDDLPFKNDTESALCLAISVVWLSVASVITANMGTPKDAPSLTEEKTITITFAWLLWLFYVTSAAIAWFAPDKDVDDIQQAFAETARQTSMPLNDSEVDEGYSYTMAVHNVPEISQEQQAVDEFDFDIGGSGLTDEILPAKPFPRPSSARNELDNDGETRRIVASDSDRSMHAMAEAWAAAALSGEGAELPPVEESVAEPPVLPPIDSVEPPAVSPIEREEPSSALATDSTTLRRRNVHNVTFSPMPPPE